MDQDKTHRLSLGSTTSLRDMGGMFNIVEDPLDPIYSTFAMVARLKAQLPLDWEGPLFLRKAADKNVKQRPPHMRHLQAGFDLDSKGKPTGVIGKNSICAIFQRLGVSAGWEGNIGGRSARRSGVTNLNKTLTNQGAVLKKSRHQNPQTNTLYNVLDANELAAVATVNHIRGKTIVKILLSRFYCFNQSILRRSVSNS